MYQSTPKKSLLAFTAGIACWNLIIAIDSTALSTALPTIAHELDASSIQAFWFGTAFVLCAAVVQPVFTSISESFGRRLVVFTSLAFFTVGAVVCGTAHTVTALLVGRCLQGCGGGGLLAMTYALMADELNLQERHKAITILSLAWMVGPIVGPILAGGFTQSSTWRWIFWFNLPFCGIGSLLAFSLSYSYVPPVAGLQRFRNLDTFGSILFISSITSFLVSISWGGTMFSWSAWQTLVPLFLGIFGLLAWVFYSLFLTEKPMVPLDMIMCNRTACISFLGNMGQGLVWNGLLYYVPVYFQEVRQFSPVMSGVAMLPLCATAGPGAAITGAIITRTNSIKYITLIGWITFIGGSSLLLLLSTTISTVAWVFLMLPTGLALGSLYASLALATQAAVETDGHKSIEEIAYIKAMAASLNPFFRSIGQALGIVICQAAFTNAVKKHLGDRVATNGVALARTIKSIPASPGKSLLLNDLNESLKPVWYVLIGVCVIFLFITLFTKDIGLGILLGSTTTDIESATPTPSTLSSATISPAPSMKVDAKEKKHRPHLTTRGSSFMSELFDLGDGVHDGFHAAGMQFVNEEKEEIVIITRTET